MKFNKNNKGYRHVADIKERYTIGDVTIKISRSCIKAIDGFIGHMQKYKRVYALIVKYIAFLMLLGLLPDLFKWIQSVDWITVKEYIRTDAIHEIDKLGNILLSAMQKLSIIVVSFITATEIIRVNYSKNKSN